MTACHRTIYARAYHTTIWITAAASGNACKSVYNPFASKEKVKKIRVKDSVCICAIREFFWPSFCSRRLTERIMARLCFSNLNSIIGFPSGRRTSFLHSSFFILHSKSAHPLANYHLPSSTRPLFATMESVFFEGNDADKATKGGKTGKRARKARLGENERNWPIFVKNILPALGIPFVTLPT